MQPSLISFLCVPETHEIHEQNFVRLRTLMQRFVLPQASAQQTVRLVLLFSWCDDYGTHHDVDKIASCLTIQHVAQYYGEMSSLVENENQLMHFDPLIVLPCGSQPPVHSTEDLNRYVSQYASFFTGNISVVLFGHSEEERYQASLRIEFFNLSREVYYPQSPELYQYIQEVKQAYPFVLGDQSILAAWEKYDHVVLGGTFDRIHAGHKLMLTQMTMLAKPNGTLHVGISGDPLLKNKQFKEMIKPLEQRIADVRKLLSELKPTAQYDLFELLEPFGPTITDPRMQVIVLSEEVLKAGEVINNKRKEKGMEPLDIFCIPLVGQRKSTVKISSSRMRELEATAASESKHQQ